MGGGNRDFDAIAAGIIPFRGRRLRHAGASGPVLPLFLAWRSGGESDRQGAQTGLSRLARVADGVELRVTATAGKGKRTKGDATGRPGTMCL